MKKIVIIGGGFAGSNCAIKLEKNFDVTLIDTKDYFEFTPGVLRTIVEPEHISKIQVMHDHYLKRAKLIVGHVTEISDKYVLIKKRKIIFDYLIIASGSSYNSPFKEKNVIHSIRARNLRNYYEQVCKAKSILIIGGGLVAVELAGELCSKYFDKEITIVHSKEKLIERNPPKAINYAEDFLKKRNVKLIFNNHIKGKIKNKWITNKGLKLNADLVFICTGITPNFDFIKKNFSYLLNYQNHIKVNGYLQVDGKQNIFAVGDVNNIVEEKTAQNAKRQAKLTLKNICNLEKNKNLEEYVPKKTPLVISLGKRKGIFVSNNFVLTGFIPSLMKDFIEFKEMLKKKH